MVNKEMIKYIKTEEAQGFTPKQLKKSLIGQGYDAKEVDEAISHANDKNIYPAPEVQQGKSKKDVATSISANKSTTIASIKKRNTFLVFLLGIFTLGIYPIYWTVSTINELRKNNTSAPSPWLLLLFWVPFFMIYFDWRYAKAVHELTDGISPFLLMILLIFAWPIGMVIAQVELNKKAV